MDYTGMETFVLATVATTLLGLAAFATAKMQPGVVRWGFNKLIGWFK